MVAWDAVGAALAVVVWICPWHMAALWRFRLQWSDRAGRRITALSGAYVICLPVPRAVVGHDWPGVIVDVLIAGSAGYALWRAWREHRPHRRRLRDKARDAVQRLVERMQPARAPLPVRAFGGA